MNEAETRAELIDPGLREAGWGVVEGSRIQREFPVSHGRIQAAGKRGKRGKTEIADYVLVYRNTKLAVIEAKALAKHYSEGVPQAKGYAQKLAVRFTYSTNGQAIYAIDMRSGVEGDMARFPSPAPLAAPIGENLRLNAPVRLGPTALAG